MKNNFPPIKWHTFIFGTAPEENFSGLVETAESMGCEYVQALAGMALIQPSLLAPPGTQPTKMPVLKLIVRIPKDEVEAINERIRVANAGVVK